MIAMLGLSVDLGRMYIARNEAQTYADSAAMKAALELDGTFDGLTRAQRSVAQNPNRWHMGNSAFAGTVTEFAPAAGGPWNDSPASAEGLRFARVRATVDPPLYFIPIVGQSSKARVNATAVAGQVPKTSFREGLFPFSPMAHSADDPEFGFKRGRKYTLRWAANPRKGANVCEGDDAQPVIDKATSAGSELGYIDDNSPSGHREAIEGDYQVRPLAAGDGVEMTGGLRQDQRASVVNRVRQDSDAASRSYADYRVGGRGNGRRLVVVPVSAWQPSFSVAGFAAFFLLAPDDYAQNADEPLCAEFVGAYVQGGHHQGAGGAGAYAVRLVE